MSELVASPRRGPWATFHLADEIFAVNAADVQEVMMQQPLTPVPLAPPYIVGLLNLRGQVMPAIDLRRRLLFSPREDDNGSSLLVVKTKDHLYCVVVDSIGDILELQADGWQPPPDTLAPVHKRFVFGIYSVERDIVLGLRVDALANEDEASPSESRK